MKGLPFTFSHPAAVLPIPRRHLSFSAMVVGAMAPDYLYFFQLSHSSRYGHTWPGMVLFSLPAGLVVLWLYHSLFKRPLLALAPDQVAKRVTSADLQFSFWPASRFGMLAVAVMIGVLSHVLWDDFTHEQGLFVTMAPDLKLYFGLDMPLYSFLQFSSTVIGAGLLTWAYWRWVKRTPLHPQPVVPQVSVAVRVLILAVCLAAMMAFALPYGLNAAKEYFARDWWSVFIVKTVIGSITAGLVELFVYSVAWHLHREKAPEMELEG